MKEEQKVDLLLNYEKQMDHVISFLDEFTSNLYGFLELVHEVSQLTLKNEDLSETVDKLTVFTKTILKHVNSYVSSAQNIIKSNKVEEKAFLELKERTNYLQTQWQSQQLRIGELTAEIDFLQMQYKWQCGFCTKVGATMGNILWKCCKAPQTLDIIMGSENFRDFFTLSNGIIVSFMETFKGSPPPLDTDEYRLVISLCGILTNVVAQQEGRQFIVHEKIGLSFINNIINYLSYLKSPTASVMKRMFLMFLYNLCIDRRGACLIQTTQAGLANIVACLNMRSPVDVLELTLKLLLSLLTESMNMGVVQKLIAQIPKKELQVLLHCDAPSLVSLSTKLIYKIDKLS